MKFFFHKEVPLWVAVLMLVLILGAALVAFVQFRKTTYYYSFELPMNSGIPQAFAYGPQAALNNQSFYDTTLNDLIAKKSTFINADLSSMQLRYYVNGVVADSAPILAKGRVGSWWETPAGLYSVVEKVPSDFSGFAHVYSPWALDFQGNFLIHGWPYYPDGTPVGSTYSGGCIRLSTDDAKKLYGMVAVGTPVLVSSADFHLDNFQEQALIPPITANNYFAADLKSNFVMAEKNPDEVVPIASLTKLMTALVAVEYVNIEKTITITPDMLASTSIPRLKVGEQLSLYDLLQPLLKESSNEAAVAIADFLGPHYFVNLMNQTAQSIGMTHTHFEDVSGSSWNNVSTARDQFTLAQYLYDNRSFILKMTTNNNDPNAYGPSAFPALQNFNVFNDDPDFVGGKVGLNGATSGTILSVFNGNFTNSGGSSSIAATTTSVIASDTAMSTMTSTTLVAKRPFMFVILGSKDYEQEARAFLAWIQSRYQ